MTRKKLYVSLALVALILAGYYFITSGKNKEKYITATASRGEISEQIAATGILNPVVTVQVGSQVTGRIKNLYADFNTHVTKGQLVAEIDPDPYQAKVDTQRANVAAQLAGVSTAKANLEKAKVDLALSKKNLTRADALYKKGIVSTNDLDVAQTNYNSGITQVKAQEAAYRSALAQVDQAKGTLESTESDLSYTKIISPVDGIVISRSVDVGQTVSASLQAPTLFLIAQDLTKMQVNASVVEADIGKVHEGQEATFRVDAHPEIKFSGEVKQVRNSPVVVQNVVTYDVIIGVENPDLKLKPGMTANVSVLIQHRDDVLVVPNAAFRFRPPADEDKEPQQSVAPRLRRKSAKEQDNSAQVWILTKDEKLQGIRVRTGITDGSFTEITEGGLKEGDKVVIGMTSEEKKPAASGSGGGGRGSRGPRMRF